MGKVIETVTPPQYRYVAQCAHDGCHYRVGLDDLGILRASAGAHAYASKHDVTLTDESVPQEEKKA